MYDSIADQTEAIGNQVEVLKTKLDEAKAKQAMLIARSQAADTKKQLAKSVGGIDTASAMEKFDRMEEKVQRKEAEADAFTEIAGSGQDLELQDSFQKIESDAKVDAELQRLMAEMGQAPAGGNEVEADIADEQ